MKKNLIISISFFVIFGIAGVIWYFWFNNKVVVIPAQDGPVNQVGLATTSLIVDKPLTEEQKQAFANDHDLDGISNEKEAELGLSPTEFDTDHDGVSDLVEINNSKTDPKNADTDGDGYADGVEILSGHDPLKK